MYSLRGSWASHFSSKKNVRPLTCSKKVSQTDISLRQPFDKRIRRCGRRTPLVKSYSLRSKARPGKTTEHVKFSDPVKSCLWNSVNNSLHFWSLTSGKRASMLMVSSVIPENCSTVTGPSVFSCAIGTPKYWQRLKNLLKSDLHLDSDSAINKKSSNMWRTPDAARKCLVSHYREVLKASKIAHEEEQPIGRHR